MDDYCAPDGGLRCGWAAASAEELRYHDEEWGFPVGEDHRLFEKVCLEGFQSGLSWRTILDKRENFREAFDGFDFELVAEYDDADVDRLLSNAGIVRHRGKIEATINNARRALELRREAGSLAAYFWQYEVSEAEMPMPQQLTQSPSSRAMAHDLKRRGWKFIGPTTAFAFIQAMGLVNDHSLQCVVRPRVAAARAAFVIPSA